MEWGNSPKKNSQLGKWRDIEFGVHSLEKIQGISFWFEKFQKEISFYQNLFICQIGSMNEETHLGQNIYVAGKE